MLRVRYEHCLGFCSGDTGGNPAGVVLPEQDQLLNDAERQALAKALGFAETVFVSSIVVHEKGSAVCALRYFTPEAEVDLCGHATIACLGLLHTRHLLSGATRGELQTRAGSVGFRIESPSKREAEAVVFMQQLAPTIGDPLMGTALSDLATALRISEDLLARWSKAWPPRVASTGLRDLMLCVPGPSELRALQPDMVALSRLSKKLDVVGLHAFCIPDPAELEGGAHDDSAMRVDLHVRNFAPLFGIDEESATGTSNCALACA